jgi:hypothetical protein
MSVAWTTLKAGDRLYDVRKATGRARWGGNEWSVWTLEVLDVEHEKGRALVSWNGNKAEWKTPAYFRQANIRRQLPKGDRS